MQKDKNMKYVISLNRYCSLITLILVRNRVRDSIKFVFIFIEHLEWMRTNPYVTCGSDFKNIFITLTIGIFGGYFEN